MNAVERLLDEARKQECGGVDRIVEPNWSAGRWEWEHYVAEVVRDLWEKLPAEARIVEYLHAAHAARSDDPGTQDYC